MTTDKTLPQTETPHTSGFPTPHPDPELDAALQEMHARLRAQEQATYRLAEVMTERAVGASGVSYFARNWLIGVIRDALTHEFSAGDVRALDATL